MWGNALGWFMSLVLLALLIFGVHSLRDIGLISEPTSFGRDAANLFRRKEFGAGEGVTHDHCPSRYRCTNVTASAPSPTADATRLTDWERTSPATNRPGRLDSSR